MSKSRREREELNRVQFTKLIVKIKKDIDKLDELYLKDQVAFNVLNEFDEAFDTYIDSSHSLKDYMTFRQRALSIKYDNRFLINKPDTKQVVCNIVLGILGLGVIYGLAVGINYLLNDKALFFKPEAANRVEAIIDDIDALTNNPLAASHL